MIVNENLQLTGCKVALVPYCREHVQQYHLWMVGPENPTIHKKRTPLPTQQQALFLAQAGVHCWHKCLCRATQRCSKPLHQSRLAWRCARVLLWAMCSATTCKLWCGLRRMKCNAMLQEEYEMQKRWREDADSAQEVGSCS